MNGFSKCTVCANWILKYFITATRKHTEKIIVISFYVFIIAVSSNFIETCIFFCLFHISRNCCLKISEISQWSKRSVSRLVRYFKLINIFDEQMIIFIETFQRPHSFSVMLLHFTGFFPSWVFSLLLQSLKTRVILQCLMKTPVICIDSLGEAVIVCDILTRGIESEPSTHYSSYFYRSTDLSHFFSASRENEVDPKFPLLVQRKRLFVV